MNYLLRITIQRIITLSLLCFIAHISANAQGEKFIGRQIKNDSKADIKGEVIYLLEQDRENETIKIGFINKQDGTRYFFNTRIMKHGPFSYIKIGGEAYYLDCDAAPTLESDICKDLRKIQPDTTVKSGEPLPKNIIVAFLIDQKGDLVTSGIAMSTNDDYYDNKTLQLLKRYSNDKNVPASLHGKPISYLVRISTIFNQGKCQIMPN
jgi:hypothetical protein